MILQEMPALSPDVLRLGLRLADAGYSVYIPLLWGGKDENASSDFVFLRHAVELTFSPRWQVQESNVNRPVLDDLASLCHEYILPQHPKQHLGVIGNCLTGIFPFALATRVPEITAPIASQPAIPLSSSDKGTTGLSESETKALTRRIQSDSTFQMLGFRFEKDLVSPCERFKTLDEKFSGRFLNGTIPFSLYHDRDKLQPHVHSVLTGCYLENKAPSTLAAWNDCIGFLDAKINTPTPRIYKFHQYGKIKCVK